jgi:hypothetical protein
MDKKLHELVKGAGLEKILKPKRPEPKRGGGSLMDKVKDEILKSMGK